MKIAVYCASTDGRSEAIRQAAAELGNWIGQNGHTLVYGGSSTGLMGITADAVIAAGGHVIGVVPDVPEITARIHPNLTETILTANMMERKQRMLDLADGYVALPGGPGTLDEVSDILALMRLHIQQKPCVLFSPEDYWQPVDDMLTRMEAAGYLDRKDLNQLLITPDLNALQEHLLGPALVEIQPDSEEAEAAERINREAFPENEYVPVPLIFQLKDEGMELLALKDHGHTVGFSAIMRHGRSAYISYLAIDGNCRGSGLGGKLIEMLIRRYKGLQLVVDYESPDVPCDNRAQRERRRAFYLQRGFAPTGMTLDYMETRFEAACAGKSFDHEDFVRLLQHLHSLVPDFDPHLEG